MKPKRWRKPWTIHAGSDGSPLYLVQFPVAGEYDRALASGQRALALATATGIPHAHRANIFLGQVYHIQGDYRQAMDVSGGMGALEGDLRYERFGQTVLPSVFSRACLSFCLAEVGAFAEGRAVGEEGCGLPRRSASFQPGDCLSGCRSALPAPRRPAPGVACCSNAPWTCVRKRTCRSISPCWLRPLGAAYMLAGVSTRPCGCSNG